MYPAEESWSRIVGISRRTDAYFFAIISAPLLNAYQESIVEKDLLIRDYESEFNRFTAKLKHVVEENDAMHLSSSNMAAELAEHRSKSGMAIAERDALRRECAELKDKVIQLGGKLKEVHELYEQKGKVITVMFVPTVMYFRE